MTGVKVRLMRGGVWTEVDAEDVRQDEWPMVVTHAKRFGQDGWAIAAALAQWIRALADRNELPVADGRVIPRA